MAARSTATTTILGPVDGATGMFRALRGQADYFRVARRSVTKGKMWAYPRTVANQLALLSGVFSFLMAVAVSGAAFETGLAEITHLTALSCGQSMTIRGEKQLNAFGCMFL